MWRSQALAVADEVAVLTAVHAGDRLVGVYAIGSIARDDVGPSSDVDVLAVLTGAIEVDRLAEDLISLAERAPVRGLEYVAYRQADLRPPRYPLPYLLNVDAGRGMQTSVSTSGDPAHWFLLDVAGSRDVAVALAGPPLTDVCDEPPRQDVLAAVAVSLDWHLANEASSANAVLNAARSLRFARHGDWLSKTEAGRWVMEDQHGPEVVASALDARRHGRDEALPSQAVQAFVRHVSEAVRAEAA